MLLPCLEFFRDLGYLQFYQLKIHLTPQKEEGSFSHSLLQSHLSLTSNWEIMGISSRDGGAEAPVFWNSECEGLWVIGKEGCQDRGEGQIASLEMPNTNALPPTCVVGCIFSFFFSNIRWKLASPEERKALKASGPSSLPGWLGIRGQRWRVSPCSSGSHLIMKWEDLLPRGNVQWPGEFNYAWQGHVESSAAWWSVKQEKAKSPDFWKPLF